MNNTIIVTIVVVGTSFLNNTSFLFTSRPREGVSVKERIGSAALVGAQDVTKYKCISSFGDEVTKAVTKL